MWKTWTSGPEMGPITSPAAPGLQSGPGGWHPTVLYMLALVVAEAVVVAWLSRHLLSS